MFTLSLSSRGGVIVEFALVAPLILLLLIGTVDCGRLVYNYMVLTRIAQEGVLLAARGVAGLEEGEFSDFRNFYFQYTKQSDAEGGGNHWFVQKRIEALINLHLNEFRTLSLEPNPPYDPDPDRATIQIETRLQLPHKGSGLRQDFVSVRVRAQYRSVLPLLDRVPITVSETGPYLYARWTTEENSLALLLGQSNPQEPDGQYFFEPP